MAIQKKHGKGRLDKWYKLAKEKGYRARAAFKLIQLNKKYHFLEKSKVLLDLCAAPGSWCQVASEVMPPQSLIVGVDLAPIKPIPRCITFQSDITSAQCRATIRQHLKTWKADVVLHDGAPNVGTAWVQDAFTQAELVLQSLKLATEFLLPGGIFVTKVFRSKDYNALLWVFNQLFSRVEATKPPSSRNVSAEIFVVCRDFKAPKKIDPRFLDAKSVFAELADPAPNNEAKVFKPEIKKRKREGYEEGDWTQFKEAPASEFIQTSDPIAMLGSLNKLSFEQSSNGDLALATLQRLPETTTEILDCCNDLKVLGRKEFKLLLKWRLRVRDIFGFSSKTKDHVKTTEVGDEDAAVETTPMDEDMKIQEEMQRLRDESDTKKKKARRRDNERKQRDIVRMQMNMTTPHEIGLDQSEAFGEDAVFNLNSVTRSGSIEQVAKGRMHTVLPKIASTAPTEIEVESDEEGDNLESQLDQMYSNYQEKRMANDAKYRAKRARDRNDDEFEGLSDDEDQVVSSDEDVLEDDESESEDEGSRSNFPNSPSSRDTVSKPSNPGGLSRRAASFFDNDLFEGIVESPAHVARGKSELQHQNGSERPLTSEMGNGNTGTQRRLSNSDSDSDFEIVKDTPKTDDDWSDNGLDDVPHKNGRPDIDIITAEAMTLAHELATNPSGRQNMIDDSFNRYSHRDTDGLPEWFLDDEDQHSKLQRPITAAAAAAIKQKLRALNARPIKKVREAQARKKMRAAQRLEKLKKKSALLMEEEMTEGDKAKAIASLMAKAGKRKPRRQVQLVVAKGGNKGLSGRPRGVKGKYKMVDSRMKKDLRGLKRAAKRK